MATLPIHLEVEDVAVGPVLIALRKMPGIIKLHLDLLGDAATASHREPKSERPAKSGAANAERIVALLMQNNGGPLKVGEIMRAIGCTKSSAYTAMYTLKKKKVVQSPHAGEYELTDKAKRELLPDQAPKLLTAPKSNGAKPAKVAKTAKTAKTESGRAAPGTGQKLLLQALAGGALKRDTLIKQLGENGMSEKSVTGVMARAKDAKLIKSLGAGSWELTAKGTNHQAADAVTSEA
jgi:hypothetical protein